MSDKPQVRTVHVGRGGGAHASERDAEAARAERPEADETCIDKLTTKLATPISFTEPSFFDGSATRHRVSAVAVVHR